MNDISDGKDRENLKIRRMTEKGHQKFSRENRNFFLKRSLVREFFSRPPKLGAKPPPMGEFIPQSALPLLGPWATLYSIRCFMGASGGHPACNVSVRVKKEDVLTS